MPSDYKVARLEHEYLARQANRLRQLAYVSLTDNSFDVVDLLYHVVLPQLKRLGKEFRVEVDDLPRENDDPASVDLLSRVLDIANWVIRGARAGDPHCRLIVAHEIAHMILHKDQEMAFSHEKAVRLNFLEEEESAEAQAHKFALLLLFPDEVVERTRHSDEETVSFVVLLDRRWIQDRRYEYEKMYKVTLQTFTGEQCENCGSMSVLQQTITTKCKSCGLVCAA